VQIFSDPEGLCGFSVWQIAAIGAGNQLLQLQMRSATRPTPLFPMRLNEADEAKTALQSHILPL
jgi:hypothetical protein